MANLHDPRRYRQEAANFLKLAAVAGISAELRDSYLALSIQFEQVAQILDQSAVAAVGETGMVGTPVDERNRHDFLGVPIDCLTLKETITSAARAIQSRQRLELVSMNVAKFIMMHKNRELDDDVRSSDIISVDGTGIVWAARLIGINVPERVAGIDLMEHVLRFCSAKGYHPYLLGGRADVLQSTIDNIRRRFPRLELAGSHHGYFDPDQEREIVASIKHLQADCLFIGMPTPQKERFSARNRDDLGVPFIMGVGGAFDVLSGRVHRAPRVIQNIGLEWLFRAAQEPIRLGPRYLATNAAFAAIMTKALSSRLRSHRVPRSIPTR